MAEVHNSWQDTMGEPYPIPENPVYDASNILRPTTMTPAHADMFNEIFSRLIVNTAAVKSNQSRKADRYQTCVCAGSGPREYYQWRYPGNYPG